MNDRLEWTLNFLEQYQRFPCLWKKSSPDFKNRAKRDIAEEQLLTLSGMTEIKELRAKIRSIRCTYNQELGKIKRSKCTGSGLGEVYEPKLAWFRVADSFLRENFEENESSHFIWPENSPDTYEEEKPILTTKETTQETVEVPPSTDSVTMVIRSSNFTKRPATSTCLLTRKKNKVDDSLDKAVEALKQLAARQQSAVNEFTIFGQHVASQLQCLPIEEALILQEDIQKLITAARLQSLSTKQCSSTSRQ